MVYSIIKCINGNYFIDSEGFTDLDKAKVQFHSVCQMLWNAPDVITACVMIVDENLDTIPGYKKTIRHEVTVENIIAQTEEQ